MKKSCAILFSFFLITCIPAFSQESETINLTVEDAVQYAIKGNLEIKQSEMALKSAEHAASSAWGYMLPSVSASGNFSQSFIDPNNTNLSVGGTVNLVLTPSLITTIKSASLAYEQQEIAYDTAVRQIELSVRQLFTQLLYSQEYIKVLEDSVQSARRQYESDLAKYNRGTLPQVNVLSDQVSLQSAQLTLDNQKTTFENSIATFKKTLGLSQNKEISLAGSLNDTLSIGDITLEKIQSVRKESGAMASLLKKKESAENSLLASRFSAWGPSVQIGYNLSWSGTDLVMEGLNKTKGDFKFGEDPSTNGLSVGVSIPLDGWLPWSKGGLNIANAEATLDSYDLQIENQKQTEEINIQNYLNTIRNTQANIKLAQSNIELAKQNLALTEDAYNHGTRSLLELQNARDKLNSAHVSMMSNASTLITALLNLENTIGVPFGTLGK